MAGERGALALEDGHVWYGTLVGAEGGAEGEVVFNTSMTGYQEILTDPSYAGQVVVLTYPLIGNYGVTGADLESGRPHARGLVVRHLCDAPSSWRAEGDLRRFLAGHGIVALAGVDTRALTRHLRDRGTMRSYLGPASLGEEELVRRARAARDLSEQSLIREVTTPEPYELGDDGPLVVVVDFGCKRNIPQSLARRGCRVRVVPAWTPAREILAQGPRGVVLSNGPGDPEQAPEGITLARELVGRLPLFGICLGHQLLGLGLGGKTFKLKYGHRGANHPVRDLATGRVYITAQNHGFALREEGLEGAGLVVSHRNANDGTVEGLRHRELPVFSVQYHPEASPGPRDSGYLFDEFCSLIGHKP